MDAQTLFYIGIPLGIVIGIALTLVVVKVKSLFASSEVKRLRLEKKTLEKRLQEKNRHIDEMMVQAGKLAHDLGRKRMDKKKD